MIQGIAAIDKAASLASRLDGLSAIAGPAQKSPDVSAATETTFAAALESATRNAVGTLQSAESLSLRALQGDVETREVVDAVMSAEQTLQAAVAIRDKIVSSYLEISRMAI